ncbi:MAG: sigma 54-interacting transcriptional regulator [Peptostreptococcaceae bacterium]|nr:sigma 54-interacting transcriptional regulator [Peptostreptococcaceae bacterium]
MEQKKTGKKPGYEWAEILEYIDDGIYITDGESNTIYVNSSYEKISGVSRKHFLGKKMSEIINEKLISESGSLKAIEKKKTVTMQQTLSGEKNVFITSRPIFDDKGSIVMVVTVVRDITLLSKLQRELHENKKKIEKYSSEISKLQEMAKKEKDIICMDLKTRKIIAQCQKVAEYDASVFVTGETGTGKEVFARYIHKNSLRKDKGFIDINCAAIPENLLESEFFGYEAGSFTGALSGGKIGFFEMADKGTLFLDEIGDLPFHMQSKLLRVIQEKNIKRIGGRKNIPIDIRLISATNKNMEELVQSGKFREDLYYRLNTVSIEIPPLRERKDDILPLAYHFLNILNEKYGEGKIYDDKILRIFQNYTWPGNIRQLSNHIEQLFIMSESNLLSANENDYFGVDIAQTLSKDNWNLKEAVSKLEAELVRRSFERCGNVKDAAELLGVDASTFVRKRQRYKKMGLFE